MRLSKSPPSPKGESEALPRILLVPLDGSSMAEEALPAAAAIAHRIMARLHLATAIQHVPPLLASGEEPAVDAELEQELRDQAGEYLKSTAEALGTTHGLEVSYAVLDGSPAQALADHSRAKRVGLMVMTTHGHTGLNRLWLGSVADRLLRWVKVPVLLLHPKGNARPAEFRHTVVALDGLSEGERVLDPAIELGCLCPDSQFTLVQVVEPPAPLITRLALQPAKMRPHWRELHENCARSYLERVATRMRTRGLRVDTQMISGRGVAQQIVSLAQVIGADLLAVGTHGARGVERMLLGSVADKVIRGATQAVLVVPTRKDAE